MLCLVPIQTLLEGIPDQNKHYFPVTTITISSTLYNPSSFTQLPNVISFKCLDRGLSPRVKVQHSAQFSRSRFRGFLGRRLFHLLLVLLLSSYFYRVVHVSKTPVKSWTRQPAPCQLTHSFCRNKNAN